VIFDIVKTTISKNKTLIAVVNNIVESTRNFDIVGQNYDIHKSRYRSFYDIGNDNSYDVRNDIEGHAYYRHPLLQAADQLSIRHGLQCTYFIVILCSLLPPTPLLQHFPIPPDFQKTIIYIILTRLLLN
jgi:hypothetical protein